MDETLKAALAQFVARGGKLFEPGSDSDIAAANAELAAHDCPELSPDYVAFLRQANGCVCERILLYPVTTVSDGVLSTVNATIKERKAGHFDRCHVVGQYYNTFMPLLRDWATGEYRWHEEDGSLMFRYDTFESMLDDLGKPITRG